MTITCIIHELTTKPGKPGAYLISPTANRRDAISVPESVVKYIKTIKGTYPKLATQFEIEEWWATKNDARLAPFPTL